MRIIPNEKYRNGYFGSSNNPPIYMYTRMNHNQ